ncbi:MAG: mobile mystery protein B [Coriobacteriia bacterium]|nr:mobile mystery protein B [Coriobacteriia bacterium]
MTAFDLFDEPEGATPLDPDDAKGLIPTWVATQGDLNAAEQANIATALTWASTSARMGSPASLMTAESMKTLHRRMFRDVWKWAGTYRQHDTNMGTHWPYISTQVRELLADVLAQTADTENLPWSADELAVRFHHRLVVIHPFANGNGRHSRLAADLVVSVLGEPVFTWGSENLSSTVEARRSYLQALRTADNQYDYRPLLEFARF